MNDLDLVDHEDVPVECLGSTSDDGYGEFQNLQDSILFEGNGEQLPVISDEFISDKELGALLPSIIIERVKDLLNKIFRR